MECLHPGASILQLSESLFRGIVALHGLAFIFIISSATSGCQPDNTFASGRESWFGTLLKMGLVLVSSVCFGQTA
jgi:hypothetical protein